LTGSLVVSHSAAARIMKETGASRSGTRLMMRPVIDRPVQLINGLFVFRHRIA
jgi:hypothetical protein